jgi:hypothetical protein
LIGTGAHFAAQRAGRFRIAQGPLEGLPTVMPMLAILPLWSGAEC